jgi:CheY-like chemotaxis protein
MLDRREGDVATTTWSQPLPGKRGLGTPGGTSADVLVVDDDHLNRTFAGSVLRSAGFRTDEAEDGFVALERLRSMSVGSVLVDVDLPGLGGMRLLEKLDNPPPVIFMSPASHGGEFMLRHSEAYTVIKKPISSVHLLVAVSRALGAGLSGMPVTTEHREVKMRYEEHH